MWKIAKYVQVLLHHALAIYQYTYAFCMPKESSIFLDFVLSKSKHLPITGTFELTKGRTIRKMRLVAHSKAHSLSIEMNGQETPRTQNHKILTKYLIKSFILELTMWERGRKICTLKASVIEKRKTIQKSK